MSKIFVVQGLVYCINMSLWYFTNCINMLSLKMILLKCSSIQNLSLVILNHNVSWVMFIFALLTLSLFSALMVFSKKIWLSMWREKSLKIQPLLLRALSLLRRKFALLEKVRHYPKYTLLHFGTIFQKLASSNCNCYVNELPKHMRSFPFLVTPKLPLKHPLSCLLVLQVYFMDKSIGTHILINY